MTKGWKSESVRHGLARKGVKTGKKSAPKKFSIAGAKEVTSYISDEGFEFIHEPIEGTITAERTKDGYVVKYLTRDLDAQSPEELGDENLLLVHYHTNFDVRRDEIITEDDARALYQGEKIPQEKKYWIFPVEAYIHGGVSLTLDTFKGRLPQGHYEFDVSHSGLVLVSKEEFKSEKKAEKVAEGLVEDWNTYHSGDVYGIVKETYDKNKNQIDHDATWGYYGQKDAMLELKNL